MKTIISFLEAAKVARKQVHQNLTIFPLLGPELIEPEYLTLEQALESRKVRITELDKNGSVPELKLTNKSKKSVLVIEGEELMGAKQNRIVNATFLIAAETEVVIPVSCVEQGRWNYESDEFASGKKVMHASLRRDHQQDVSYNLREGQGYRSDQGRIWNNIKDKMARMKTHSSTAAMAAMYVNYEDRLGEFVDAFQLVDLQVGAIFAINGRVLGLEAFGCHDTFNRLFDKLIKSYALDALELNDTEKPKSVPPDKARRFVASINKCKGSHNPSLGMGENITFGSRSVSGASLIVVDRLYHLSVFKKETKGSRRVAGMQRFSQRRRSRLEDI